MQCVTDNLARGEQPESEASSRKLQLQQEKEEISEKETELTGSTSTCRAPSAGGSR